MTPDSLLPASHIFLPHQGWLQPCCDTGYKYSDSNISAHTACPANRSAGHKRIFRIVHYAILKDKIYFFSQILILAKYNLKPICTFWLHGNVARVRILYNINTSYSYYAKCVKTRAA